MENFIKGIFKTFILFVVMVIVSIIFLVWVYGYFVYVYNSPLSLTLATKQYFIDSLLDFIVYVGVGIFWVMTIQYAINNRRDDDEYDLQLRLMRDYPTPSYNVSNNAQNTTPDANKVTSSQSRGETVMVTEHTDNGGIFHHVVKGSPEWQAVIKRNAERQNKQFKNEVNENANIKLKQIFMENENDRR